MENNTIDIIKHFSEIYKIHFTDKEANLLRKFFTESDIGNAKYHICPISNIDNFKTQTKLISTISDDMEQFHLEELVYARVPYIPTVAVEYESKLQHSHGNALTTTGSEMDEDLENFVIIRTTTYDLKNKQFVHEYYIYIYNPKLDVVGGGIMFEDI